jgi:hypothetical protein
LYLYVKRGESPAFDFVSQKFRVVCKNVFLLCKVVILVDASTEHDIVGHFVGIKLTHSLKQLTYFISAKVDLLTPMVLQPLIHQVYFFIVLVEVGLVSDLF